MTIHALAAWATRRADNAKAVSDAARGLENIHERAHRLSRAANETSFSKTPERSLQEHKDAASAMREAAKDSPDLKKYYKKRAEEHDKKAAQYQHTINERKRDEHGRFA